MSSNTESIKEAQCFTCKTKTRGKIIERDIPIVSSKGKSKGSTRGYRMKLECLQCGKQMSAIQKKDEVKN